MADTTSTGPAPASGGDALAAEIEALAPLFIDHVNVEYDDSLLLIGRVLGERPGAPAARIAALDVRGVDLVITDGDAEHPHRLAYGSELASADQLSAELFGFVLMARERSGEAGTTSAERVMQEMT